MPDTAMYLNIYLFAYLHIGSSYTLVGDATKMKYLATYIFIGMKHF